MPRAAVPSRIARDQSAMTQIDPEPPDGRPWSGHSRSIKLSLRDSGIKLARERETNMRTARKAFGLALVLTAVPTSALASPEIVLPLKLAGRFPIVMAKVDGLDVPLILGTGDSLPVVLQQSVLDHIKAAPAPPDATSMGLDVKGNLLHFQKFRVSRLQLGDAVFTDVIASLDIHARNNQLPDVGQKGLLGTGLLKPYKVVLDYAHLTMTLVPAAANDTQTELCHGTSVPFAVTPSPTEPFTKVDTDVGQLTLAWDTASTYSFVSQKVMQRGLAPSSNEDVTTKRFVIGDADFGPWQFKWMEMSLPPFFDGSIGYDFLLRHVVCIDFPNRRVLIQR
jgi:hypothetical protein